MEPSNCQFQSLDRRLFAVLSWNNGNVCASIAGIRRGVVLCFAEVAVVGEDRTSNAGRVTGDARVAIVLADAADGSGQVGQFLADRLSNSGQTDDQTENQHRGEKNQF